MLNKIIFCVKDVDLITQLINKNLEGIGFTIFESGEKLLADIIKTTPDLYCLNTQLPGIDGFEVCKQIKMNPITKNIPIIMILDKSEEFDQVINMEVGADDYISKPFNAQELHARIKVLLKKSNSTLKSEESRTLKYNDITLDETSHKVFKEKQEIELSIKEFDLLKLFIINRGKVLAREILIDNVWGFDYICESRTVDVHIHSLRKKIENNKINPVYIETVRGIGYRLKDL